MVLKHKIMDFPLTLTLKPLPADGEYLSSECSIKGCHAPVELSDSTSTRVIPEVYLCDDHWVPWCRNMIPSEIGIKETNKMSDELSPLVFDTSRVGRSGGKSVKPTDHDKIMAIRAFHETLCVRDIDGRVVSAPHKTEFYALAKAQGFTVREIADTMGVKVGAVTTGVSTYLRRRKEAENAGDIPSEPFEEGETVEISQEELEAEL